MKSFHERLDEIMQDLASNNRDWQYCAGWIAKLQGQVEQKSESIEHYENLTCSVLNHNEDLLKQRTQMSEKLIARQEFIDEQFEKIKGLEQIEAELRDAATVQQTLIEEKDAEITRLEGMPYDCDRTLRDEIDRLKKVIEEMAKELGLKDLAENELNRKLDAANTLLHDKDVMIQDLRESRDRLVEEQSALCLRKDRKLNEVREKMSEEAADLLLKLDKARYQRDEYLGEIGAQRTLKEQAETNYTACLEQRDNYLRNRDALREEICDLHDAVSRSSSEIDNRNARIRDLNEADEVMEKEIRELREKVSELKNEHTILNDNNAKLKRIIGEAHASFHS